MKRSFRALLMRRAVVAALLVPMVALAAGCGSSSSSSRAGEGSSSSDPGSTSSAVASSGVSAAKAFLAPYLKPPTKISISEPLKRKPPCCKSVIFLQLNVPGTNVIGDAVQEATKALGWKYGVLPFDQAQPQSLQAAFNTALLKHPDLVFVVAQDVATWGSQTIARYKAAGVRLLAGAIPPVPGGWVIGDPNAPSNNVLWGKILAAEFTVDSNGHGNVVLGASAGVPRAERGRPGIPGGSQELLPRMFSEGRECHARPGLHKKRSVVHGVAAPANA